MSTLPGQPLIVLAIGRSGTSYLARFLQANGVHIGSQLVEKSAINPRGFFEDKTFVEFHQRLLERRARHESGPLLQPLAQEGFTREDEDEAIRIVEAAAKPGFWGWKDPRTIHYIDSWLRLLPDAKLIIPIRHPLEVFYSYLKRAPLEALFHPLVEFFPAYAQQARRLLEVARRHMPRAYILEAHQAFRQPSLLWKGISNFLGIEGQPGNIPPFYSDELTQLAITKNACDLFGMLCKDASDSFWRLNEIAGIPFRYSESARFDSAMAKILSEAGGEDLQSPEWLAFLFECCAPKHYKGYLQYLAEVPRLEREHALQLEGSLSEYRTHTANLEIAVSSLQATVREQAAALAAQEKQIEALMEENAMIAQRQTPADMSAAANGSATPPEEDTVILIDQDTDVLNGMPTESGDVVIGVGADCTVGYQVRRYFGIDRSFPFDWLITPMPALIKCIETDFDGFLERDALEYSEAEYLHIVDQNYGIHYVHHFDRSPDFLDKYDLVKAKFNRRIARWRTALEQATRVLFVRQSLVDERDKVEDLCRALDRVLPGRWLLLCAGSFYPNQRTGQVQYARVGRHPKGDYRGIDEHWNAAFQLTGFRRTT